MVPPDSSSWSVRRPDDEVFFGACGAFDVGWVAVANGVVGEFVDADAAPDVRLFWLRGVELSDDRLRRRNAQK